MDILITAAMFGIGFGVVFALGRSIHRKALRQPVVIRDRRMIDRRKLW